MYLAHNLFFLCVLPPLHYQTHQARNLSFASEVTSVGTVASLLTYSLFFVLLLGPFPVWRRAFIGTATVKLGG